MSKFFYRDIKLIKFCKVKGCGAEYRPVRYSFFAQLGLCHKHRSVYYREVYLNRYLPFFNELSPEGKQKYRLRRYEVCEKWVIKNSVRRRKQALESYHRNKDKHKERRHLATHIKPSSILS